MKTFTTLVNLATTLTGNTSSTNQVLLGQLINDQHRYTLENYFDNETSFSTETIGAMNLTLASEPAAGATSATLSSAWNYASGEQQIYLANAITQPILSANLAIGATSGTLSTAWTYTTQTQATTFSDGEIRNVLYTQSSTAISWTGGLTSAVTTALTITLPPADSPTVQFTKGSTAITWQEPLNSYVTSLSFSTGGFQKYRIPANVSKITNNTITVGTLRFVPAPVMTRTQWDTLNFLPYPSDIPNYFFLYGGYAEFWPVPSTTGNKITFNYKSRVPDLNFTDYSTGNITALTVNGVQVTGTGTSWNTTGLYPLNVDISSYNLYLKVNPPYGDGIWYLIQQFNSDTSLTLAMPIQNAPNITAASTYTIGQLPLLSEDFHDALVYGALMQYYTHIVPDPNKFGQSEKEYKRRLQLLEDYAGTKQVSYNLGEKPVTLNANSYPFYPTNYQ